MKIVNEPAENPPTAHPRADLSADLSADVSADVTAAQAGDKAAFSRLVQRFQDMAFATAYARLGQPQLAEEAAQEAFLEAYLHLTKLRNPAAFPGWLRTVVIRRCNRALRRKSATLIPLEAAVHTPSTAPDPASQAIANSQRQAVHAAIQALPEAQRQVTLLFYLGGYAQKEIGEVLDVPVSTVKNRLFSARNRLHERMLQMVEETLHNERPSHSERFREGVIALITASEVGDGQAVQALLAEDPRLAGAEARPRFGAEPLTALHNAAVYGYPQIARQLLAAGADVNAASAAGWTPLQAALISGQPAVANLLLAAGAAVDIFCAARMGDEARVQAFLQTDPALAHARGPRKATPLHFAATVPVARLLLAAGADVNAQDDGDSQRYRYGTPLRWHADNPELARFLLSCDAQIDDAFLAAALGEEELLAALIDEDPAVLAQPNGPYGGGLLHTAADKGHLPVAELLLARGMAVNAPAADGAVTPLHLAAASGHTQMAALLLRHGADPSARDGEFQATPAGWAKFWGQDELAQMLG